MRSFSIKDYARVIMDGSLFINRFPEKIAQELIGTEYHVAASFKYECECYKMHMTPEQQQVFRDNGSILERGKLRTLERAPDLWSGLVYASTRGRPVLLITSNLLLIEKIVLRDLKLDIYNLHKKTFMPYDKFDAYREQYTFKPDPEVEEVKLFDAGASSLDVFDDTMWYRQLERVSDEKEGLEAYLYADPMEPESMAKIFRHKRRSSEKLGHVQKLLELNRTQLHCDWAAMPNQMLYLERDSKRPLGFLMRRFRNRRSLEVAVEVEPTAEKKVDTVLDWSIMLVTELAYLAVFGLYVTDFSGCNFLLPADDDKQDRRIRLLDVDSYCRDAYFGRKVDGEVSHWQILDAIRKSDVTKADLIDMSTRLLFAEVFYIMTGGCRAYEGTAQYAHDIGGLMDDQGKMRYMFPGALLRLTDRVLSKAALMDTGRFGKVPFLDGLTAVLLQIRQELRAEDPELDYKTLLQWYDEGREWPLNGLGQGADPAEAEPEDTTDEKFEKNRREEASKERPRKERREPERKPEPRMIRWPDRSDPFTTARLMGAVVEPEPIPVPGKVPRARVIRERATQWQQEERQDLKQAERLKKWFYKGLFLTIILLAVWLCFYAEFEQLHQIRQTVWAWLDRGVDWWNTEALPLMGRAWERIRNMFTQVQGNG